MKDDEKGEMRKAGMSPNVNSFNAASSACEKRGQWDQALSLQEEMKTMRSERDQLQRSHLSLREGSAVGAGISNDEPSTKRDQLQCGNFSVREGLAVAAS
eukprot:1616396-Karenia_brevis.AAC.1